MEAQAQEMRDPTLLRTTCYVDGDWVGASNGETFSVQNPSTLFEIAQCPEFTVQDTVDAIEAAEKAFSTFRQTQARSRSRLLRRWFELMTENEEDLARIITLENGKPFRDSKTEVRYAASFLEWFAEEAPRVYGDTIPASSPSCNIVTVKQPVGVCALIVPWNFPAAMVTRKVGPAIAAGCTVIVKAPAETPLTVLALAELAHRAGIPKGVLNVVTAWENTVPIGEILTKHPAIRKVSFTGSTAVGKLLMNQSSSTLKKLSFELGGNAPFIVFEDADLESALTGLLASKFRISGQTCVCANRIFVHRAVYKTFVEMVQQSVAKFKIGDGFDESVTHGPLVHARAVEKVSEHVRDAVSKGAAVELGGTVLSHLGPNFYSPTIITGMKPGMKICSEETFGPVAAFFEFESEDDVIALANECDVGLAGYFYSRNVSRCWRVANALDVGMVGVNTGAISDAAAPFGGVKESGFGREGSKYGIEEFTVTKMIMSQT